MTSSTSSAIKNSQNVSAKITKATTKMTQIHIKGKIEMFVTEVIK